MTARSGKRGRFYSAEWKEWAVLEVPHTCGPWAVRGVTAPGTREGSHSDARGDLPEAWASAPHKDAAVAASVRQAEITPLQAA